MIGLLQAGRGYTVEALSRIYRVTQRTIFRDLGDLRQANVPVVLEASEYRIPRPYYLPPTSFTVEEALSLILLCHEYSDQPGVPFLDSARDAAVKLEGILPTRLRQEVRSAVNVLQIRPSPANPLPEHAPVYKKLLDAAARRCSVRIVYDSLTEEEIIRTRLDPYELLFSRRSWYAIGRSSLHRENRTFNVGRVLQLQQLEESFRLPRGFSIERYLGNAWHLIPESGPDHNVLVRFSKMVARNVAEVAWHKTQKVSFNEDGTMDFSVTVSGLKEISWWILGYGDQAQVLRPAKLRKMIAQRAAKMVEQYAPEPNE